MCSSDCGNNIREDLNSIVIQSKMKKPTNLILLLMLLGASFVFAKQVEQKPQIIKKFTNSEAGCMIFNNHCTQGIHSQCDMNVCGYCFYFFVEVSKT